MSIGNKWGKKNGNNFRIMNPKRQNFWVIHNDGAAPTPPVETFFILLESGDLLLQEGGDGILTELAP
jgi:hypothetical protein